MTFFYDLNKKLASLADKEQLTEGKKPDFLDVDKDGDKKEPMKKALKDKEKTVTEGDFGPLEAAGDEPAEPDTDAIAKRKARDAARRRREEKAEADKDDLSKDYRPAGKKTATTTKVAGTRYGGAAQKDDDEETSAPATGEKRGRGRPKKAGGPRQERVTAKSRKADRTTWTKKVAEETEEWYDENGRPDPNGAFDAAGHYYRERNTNEASYSAKQARAGKDIGKPGKQFAKIAKGAAEKYGSKERGEKVAGAVLAKLRGKNESIEEGASEGDDMVKLAKVIASCTTPQQLKVAQKMASNFLAKHASEFGSIGDAFNAKNFHKDVARATAVKRDIRAKADSLQSAEPVAEKAVSKKQQKFMGMVHAAQKGEKAASSEVAKVAKEMPKKAAKDFAATKHKGLPEKVKSKKKEEEVEESGTVAGSVAPAASGGKKSAGGFTFGQGIYDSYNREVEAMISESININASTSSDGMKSLSVTATDEDVMKLAEILKMAGLGGAASGASSCPTCEQAPCACAEVVDENAPDWPTNTETNDDALQYAGGLNKPKATGQTTAPVVNRDPRRGSMGPVIEDELSKMMEMAGISEAKAKPDYIDLDKDGDKEESMKKAAKEKAEKVEESFLSKLWKEFKSQ